MGHADDVWFATGAEIAGYYRDHCWDQIAADIARARLRDRRKGLAMALPEDYLTYPPLLRHDHQRSVASPHRAARWVRRTGKAAAAMIVVPLEFHRLNRKASRSSIPATARPIRICATSRPHDYGNRVGVLHSGCAEGEILKAVFPINAVLLNVPTVEAILADGHEIAAYAGKRTASTGAGLSKASKRNGSPHATPTGPAEAARLDEPAQQCSRRC